MAPSTDARFDFRTRFRRRKRWGLGLQIAFLALLPLVLRFDDPRDREAMVMLLFGLWLVAAGFAILFTWRCPGCGGGLRYAGMVPVWWSGARLVHDCGALLQEPEVRAPAGRLSRWSRWSGLVLYVPGCASFLLSAVAWKTGDSLAPATFWSFHIGGQALMGVGCALHARARGLSILWGLVALAGVLSLPVLLAMGAPCAKCGTPRPFRWGPCGGCGWRPSREDGAGPAEARTTDEPGSDPPGKRLG